jgi:hypothetical protein
LPLVATSPEPWMVSSNCRPEAVVVKAMCVPWNDHY